MARRITAPMPADLAIEEEPFQLETLDEALADPEPLDEAVRAAATYVTTWRPTDRGGAEWAMRQTARIRDEIAQANEDAEGWMRQIEEWRASAVRPLEQRAAFFAGALISWARTVREEDPKAPATLPLPSGDVKSTTYKPAVKVIDREAVATHARANLNKADLARVLDQPPTPPPVAKAAEVKKLARIVERVLARHLRITLEDGTTTDVDVIGTEPPEKGAQWSVSDGVEDRQLEIVEVEEIAAPDTMLVAVWSDTGEPILGATVEAKGTTYEVLPR